MSMDESSPLNFQVLVNTNIRKSTEYRDSLLSEKETCPSDTSDETSSADAVQGGQQPRYNNTKTFIDDFVTRQNSLWTTLSTQCPSKFTDKQQIVGTLKDIVCRVFRNNFSSYLQHFKDIIVFVACVCGNLSRLEEWLIFVFFFRSKQTGVCLYELLTSTNDQHVKKIQDSCVNDVAQRVVCDPKCHQIIRTISTSLSQHIKIRSQTQQNINSTQLFLDIILPRMLEFIPKTSWNLWHLMSGDWSLLFLNMLEMLEQLEKNNNQQDIPIKTFVLEFVKLMSRENIQCTEDHHVVHSLLFLPLFFTLVMTCV